VWLGWEKLQDLAEKTSEKTGGGLVPGQSADRLTKAMERVAEGLERYLGPRQGDPGAPGPRPALQMSTPLTVGNGARM
jgi:hypothetical protein